MTWWIEQMQESMRGVALDFACASTRPRTTDLEARNIAYALGLVAVRTQADDERQQDAWERDLYD